MKGSVVNAKRVSVSPGARTGSVLTPTFHTQQAPGLDHLQVLDLRTAEGFFLRKVRDELLEHCGPNASVIQRAIVERAAILALYCARYDSRGLSGDGLSLHDRREYLAYSGALARTLRLLGLKRDPDAAAAAAPTARLAEVVQQIAGEDDEA